MKSPASIAVLLNALLSTQLVNCFMPKHVAVTSTKHSIYSQHSTKREFCSNNVVRSEQRMLFAKMVEEATETMVENEVENLNTVASADGSLNEEFETSTSFTYGKFAKQYPFANNIAIATAKTAAADLLAQTVIAQTPLNEIDLQRSFLFMVFGAVYLGGFQYLYQVQVFKRLFDIEKFTNLSWREKLEDKEGLKNLGLQTALDLTVLTFVYLPTFYVFKAGVFSGSTDPGVWASTGIENYVTNFAKDEADLLKVWFPADLVCFSVPLYLRLPVRHVVSFVWTAYLSFARGGH